MKSLLYMLVFAFVLSLVSMIFASPALAELDTGIIYWTVEQSNDGEVWESIAVEVPVDGWMEVEFDSGSAWVWGPECDEEDVPAATLCRCSGYMRHKCVCTKKCCGSYQYFDWGSLSWKFRSYSGTCV